jgi:lipopolysaccharide/colanic/teichoic acid biosynthesis glycosyltransferase
MNSPSTRYRAYADPTASSPPVPANSIYARFGKRCVDLAITIPAVVLLWPVLIAIAALVRWRLGAPVLFRQERVGRGDRVFRLLKFRTMTNARDGAGRLLPDNDRLTPFGLFLRRWSLDELPQLLNVLRGELSLVGPRPLLVRYLPRYTERQRRRHTVRPGITGWAQLHGRNRLAWAERFEHDLWYVAHCSLWLDLTILLRTAASLLAGGGSVAAPGEDAGVFWGTVTPPPDAAHNIPSDETDRDGSNAASSG